MFHQLILVGLLISWSFIPIFSQTDSTLFIPSSPDTSSVKLIANDSLPIKIDTIYTIDDSFESMATFSAKDSLYADVKNKKIFLYGEAKVHYDDLDLAANYIEVDMNTNEILATYTYDKDSNRIGTPVITMDGETMEVGMIKMNYETKKAYIREVKIKQDENYLYMNVAKRQANEEIHFTKGRFTTCDLPEPHYHFQLSKAVLVPDKRIVSGPMNVWIKDVPTPLGLPFAIIPQTKERKQKHGILFPQFVPMSTYGMGIQNLGYFVPINDTIQMTFYGSIYTRGSWDLSNRINYKMRYKFSGETFISFQQLKDPFPFKSRNNKLTLQWQHTQDQKANPFWNFSANVNFISDNQSKNNIDPLNANHFNNAFNSDINITRAFPGKPISMGMKVAMNQNTATQNMVLTAPTFSMNVSRFYPFKFFRKKTTLGGPKWYEQIGMTYGLEAKNQATFKDEALKSGNMSDIGNSFFNGISQNAALQSTISIFKGVLKLTPSVTYRNYLNFQQIRKELDTASTVRMDTIQRFGMSQNLSFNMQMTTVLYSYYKFIGKSEPLLRHVLTPSVGYRYIPMLDKRFHYIDQNNEEISYSPFERSLYSSSMVKDQSLIDFSLNNTFELKRKSEKDTVTGYKKTRIIDALSLSGNYDMLRDSMKLSNLSLNLRITPVNFISFTSRATFSPYSWIDSTGRTIAKFAAKDKHGIGRFTFVEFNTTFTLASKESKEKIAENQQQFNQYWDSDYRYYALHPEMYLDFTIPWKVNISHSFSFIANENRNSTNNKKFLNTHTIMVNGDISITKRWKLTATAYYDFSSKSISNLRVDITRDMHCWQMSVNWIPIGVNKSFMVTIMGTSSLLSNAKFSVRKPPQILF